MVFMSNSRMSAADRLEQLRDFVAAHDRAPSRRPGQQEDRSPGEWVAKHKNAETPTGNAVRELLDSGTMTGPVKDLEDYQKFCTEHMRAPMPGTNVEREQALWEWAEEQPDPATLAKISAARMQCRVTTPGGNFREKLAELEQLAKTYRRPLSPESKDRHEKSPAAWVRVEVASKSCPAREIEVVSRTYRADQHHAQPIAAGRLNGPVAFMAQTGRAPRLGAANLREAQLAKWVMDYWKDSTRLCASRVVKVLATAGWREGDGLPSRCRVDPPPAPSCGLSRLRHHPGVPPLPGHRLCRGGVAGVVAGAAGG